jgi:aromatic-L-amino-acid/L-tryptophan decarboxylase
MATPPPPVTDLAWSPDRARALGDAMVALWGELLERLPELPVNRLFAAGDVAAAVALPVPEEPLEEEALLAHVRELVFEQSLYAGHPGFMAYIVGSGTVPGAAADLLAAGLNPNTGGWRLAPGAVEIELQLTRWLAARIGLPDGAVGQIVTGGAMANFVGLKCARDARLGPAVRETGVRSLPPGTLYASEEAHVVIRRAADMLGLGAAAVRAIPADAEQRMRVDALEAAIAADLAAGALPVAVVATAGTTTTGSIDPLPEVADVAARHGMWLHVDAAYGGAAVLADDLRPLLAGIERADSVAIDPHKWLYTPQSGGCILVRDPGALGRAFHADATYIWLDESVREGIDLAMFGPQFSRGFAAFKVWLSLLAHGSAAYGRRISHDAALARYLAELVEEHPDFEPMGPPRLSICCFRYRPAGWEAGEAALDRLNERLLTALQADGRTYCSNAVIGSRFGLRACITNVRTEAPDVERLLAVAAELGEQARRE